MNLPPQLSRRSFGKMMGVTAAYVALQPASSRFVSRAARTASMSDGAVVRLSANENPYGPSQKALKAMNDAFSLAWRYPDEHEDALIDTLRTLNKVSSDQILLGNGSGEILRLAGSSFTDANRPLVMASPTFEAIGYHAQVAGAKVVRVPLTSDYAHDLAKMAQTNAGLVYICNPNNPTASITPKDQVRAYLAKVPESTIVLVDEAYHHYVESDSYESVIPLIEQHPNLMVARTFSKIYGMAGLRCGYCVAQASLLRTMRPRRTMDSVNIMALVAANASLPDATHVDEGRKRNSAVKKFVCGELDKSGFTYIPSHANFMMIDLRREVRPVISGLRQRGVEVGRVFPALPNFLRVTIGTQPEMETFIKEFRTVMNSGSA
ncbi:MAG TPA: aminotransferase class I/II-fold pyridoxal phosphate-dependent enzyme [Pyrinomonadaceae bacterium]|nr:aminotransferase class I/II-fold pyridoxal phosphate-dependent enzyme [Pyrinomonadaceae bacterium]